MIQNSQEYIEDIRCAELEPEFDFFEVHRPKQPKAAIGRYVMEQGFNVPLIRSQDEWVKAYDEGNAMLRSELPQDYDGLSGLLSSERIVEPDKDMPDDELFEGFSRSTLRKLRNGEIDPTEYMLGRRDYMSWNEQQSYLQESIRRFGGIAIDFSKLSASRWRYVEGSNITVFADPHIDGRYYFGLLPGPTPTGRYQGVGGYMFEKGEYDKPQQFRKHDQPFIVTPIVEFYEQIRTLPQFDTTESPVLELQQEADGTLHFLQYLKTGKKRNFVEPYDLSISESTILLTNVRGITPKEGQKLRLFIEPERLAPGMEGQAVFCGLMKPYEIEVQLVSQVASFILHTAYISFKNNHFNSSPMYRPQVAAGLEGCNKSPAKALDSLEVFLKSIGSYRRDTSSVQYLDIILTSNGHEAALESDWDIKTIAYEDVM